MPNGNVAQGPHLRTTVRNEETGWGFTVGGRKATQPSDLGCFCNQREGPVIS